MTAHDRLLSADLDDYAARQFDRRRAALEDAGYALPDGLDGDRLALMRLLAGTLPLTDLLDRDPAVLLDYVDHALGLRRDRAWTASLPEDVFVHYVFWPRINNERLEACRSRIAGDLAGRVDGLAMERAAVETNYWCAEHMTYTPTDGRTMAPLGSLNRGVGRCGEESTLLVSALRAIGIPARQVYTPRWAHCDDNHAWVEALIDGTWRFMGACEPEERLDRGWFDHAAARAMLIHARVFCDYSTGSVNVSAAAGEEHGMLLENLTAAYAPVTRFTVAVANPDGSPARHATVAFELLNMAEFYPVAVLIADDDGRATLEVGRGSLLVRATLDGMAAETVVDTAAGDAASVTLAPAGGDAARPADADGWRPLTLTAPEGGHARNAALSEQEQATGARRAEQAERTRTQRLAHLAEQARTGEPRLDALLAQAGGNWPAIARFARGAGEDGVALLEALAPKDLADTSEATLTDALEGARAVRDHVHGVALAAVDESERDDLYRRYVLNPRVRYEELNGDRMRVQSMIGDADRDMFRADPDALWERLARCIDDADKDSLHIGDAALLRARHASRANVESAFVSICRALGIPARLNPETGEPQYLRGAAFRTVARRGVEAAGADRTAPADGPTLRLSAPGRAEAPRYYVDYTIGVLADTPHGPDYVSLDLSERDWDGETMDVAVEDGEYRVVTTTRLPNGGQLAATATFDTRSAAADADGPRTVEVELRWREPEESELLERLPVENRALIDETGASVPLRRIVGERPTVLFVLDAHGSEPSMHVLDELRDMLERHPEPQADPVLAFCPADVEPSATMRRMLDRLPVRPRVWGCDPATFERLARILFVDPGKLPLTAALAPCGQGDQAATGVYACSGYNVGAVELATRLASMGAALQ